MSQSLSVEVAARALARRHAQTQTDFESVNSVLNYAERPNTGDWTLRSSLVRLAQPKPLQAGAVLQLVRRCDAALHPLVRAVEKRAVMNDRELTIEALGSEDNQPRVPYPDGRMVDLARLIKSDVELAPMALEAYESETRQLSKGSGVGVPTLDVGVLDERERDALPFLVVALHLDDVAGVLSTWAVHGHQNPPVDEVDKRCRAVFKLMESVGMPEEQGPPQRGGRRSA